RDDRSNNRSPTSSSIRRTAWLMAGWVRWRRRAAAEKLRSVARARNAARSGSCIRTAYLNQKTINWTPGHPARYKGRQEERDVGQPADDLRYHPARRRTGARFLASHRRETGPRPSAAHPWGGHH